MASYKHIWAIILLKCTILIWLNILKITVQNVYCYSYYLKCKQTHTTAIHIQGYVPVYDTESQEEPAEI
jgi:hypothetical protein